MRLYGNPIKYTPIVFLALLFSSMKRKKKKKFKTQR